MAKKQKKLCKLYNENCNPNRICTNMLKEGLKTAISELSKLDNNQKNIILSLDSIEHLLKLYSFCPVCKKLIKRTKWVRQSIQYLSQISQGQSAIKMLISELQIFINEFNVNDNEINFIEKDENILE